MNTILNSCIIIFLFSIIGSLKETKKNEEE